VVRYPSRIGGPLLYRIDLRVEVNAVAADARSAASDGESSPQIAQRVAQARERALRRQGVLGAALSGATFDEACRVDEAATRFLHHAAGPLGWSARSFDRVLRAARSVADLGGSESLQLAHLADAIQYRRLPAV
jgi:magnesium chelatase family protein